MKKSKIAARTKYNNGGLQAQKSFDGVGNLQASVGGDHNYRYGNVTASTNVGGATVSASKFKDNMRNSSSNYSVEKQLNNRSSVSATKSKNNTGITYNKQTKGGTNFQIGANRNAEGAFSASMSISKPL